MASSRPAWATLQDPVGKERLRSWFSNQSINPSSACCVTYCVTQSKSLTSLSLRLSNVVEEQLFAQGSRPVPFVGWLLAPHAEGWAPTLSSRTSHRDQAYLTTGVDPDGAKRIGEHSAHCLINGMTITF
jgi:hypothetical protein